jgi:hypothetical protein
VGCFPQAGLSFLAISSDIGLKVTLLTAEKEKRKPADNQIENERES